jgi:hypothetical protein
MVRQLKAALAATRRDNLKHGTNAAYMQGCVCSEVPDPPAQPYGQALGSHSSQPGARLSNCSSRAGGLFDSLIELASCLRADQGRGDWDFLYWSYLPSFFSVRLIRPAFHFFKRPDKRSSCLPRKANAFLVFSFSQNSSGHLSATLIRVFQSESSSCRANATMTPMM